ncbi:hypothetical protein D3C81_2191580 [compost metagenome]
MPSEATCTLAVVNPDTTAVPVALGTPYTATFFVWVSSVLFSVMPPRVVFHAWLATKRSASRLACNSTLYW